MLIPYGDQGDYIGREMRCREKQSFGTLGFRAIFLSDVQCLFSHAEVAACGYDVIAG
jgi:hypothetical protein